MDDSNDLAQLEAAIDGLFESVWSAALGSAVRAPGRAEHWPSRVEVLRARIAIRGDTAADLTLLCPRETAREFAAAFYRKPVSTIDEGELESTLLELLNILGGNLKGVLAGRNQVGLPERMSESLEPLDTSSGGGHLLSFRGWTCRLVVESPRN